MATDQKCVDYAWECIRLAGLADDPEIRDRLMDMARSCWLLRSDLISSMNVAASTTTLSTPVMARGAPPDLALGYVRPLKAAVVALGVSEAAVSVASCD